MNIVLTWSMDEAHLAAGNRVPGGWLEQQFSLNLTRQAVGRRAIPGWALASVTQAPHPPALQPSVIYRLRGLRMARVTVSAQRCEQNGK